MDEPEVISALIGTLIGGVIGFLSSHRIYVLQTKSEKKRIAKAVYIEICSSENIINLLAKGIKALPGGSLPTINQTLYPSGIYFNAMTDICRLETDLAALIFKYYNTLLLIDRNTNQMKDPSFRFTKPASEEIVSSLQTLTDIIPNLKQQLESI